MTEETINRQSNHSETVHLNQQLLPHNQNEEVAVAPKIRIKSLDIYRGLTMMGMILVDNMGPVEQPPWFLDHAPWDGLTPADLIFPAFLFIMGMAVPLAISQKRPIRLKNIVRIVLLFMIGFALNLIGKKFDFQLVRILGILQRLSICYAAILLLHFLTKYGEQYRRKIGMFIIFALYMVQLSMIISFKGGEDVGPGCTINNNLTDQCNFQGYVDRLILTPNHMLKKVYTDPEGLFSTIGAIVTTYMGYYFSLLMGKEKGNPKRLITLWLSISIIAGLLVYPMTWLMPLNKKLYSTSFTLIVVAISGSVLTFLYIIVDLLPSYMPKTKKIIEIVTAPFLWLGLNPLSTFVLMDLLAIFMILYIKIDGKNVWGLFYKFVFRTWISNQQVGAIVFACFFLVIWTIVAGIMHRFKIYVRL